MLEDAIFSFKWIIATLIVHEYETLIVNILLI